MKKEQYSINHRTSRLFYSPLPCCDKLGHYWHLSSGWSKVPSLCPPPTLVITTNRTLWILLRSAFEFNIIPNHGSRTRLCSQNIILWSWKLAKRTSYHANGKLRSDKWKSTKKQRSTALVCLSSWLMQDAVCDLSKSCDSRWASYKTFVLPLVLTLSQLV